MTARCGTAALWLSIKGKQEVLLLLCSSGTIAISGQTRAWLRTNSLVLRTETSAHTVCRIREASTQITGADGAAVAAGAVTLVPRFFFFFLPAPLLHTCKAHMHASPADGRLARVY